ncbi:MAG: hypothetical protein ACHQ9S_26295 [Candidatus Binatia bacterium]
MRDQEDAGLETIEDIRIRVEAERNAIGSGKLVDGFYSPRARTDHQARLDRWKEEWTLCSFAERYNAYNTPRLVWARRNPRGTNRADFSVYGDDRSFLCDVEVTSLWSAPIVKDPARYEDFSTDPYDPMSSPYKMLERVIEKHLRDHYPPYWLVIWDNEHAVTHPNLDDLAVLVERILAAKTASGRLPTSLQHVWVFDENDPGPRQVLG